MIQRLGFNIFHELHSVGLGNRLRQRSLIVSQKNTSLDYLFTKVKKMLRAKTDRFGVGQCSSRISGKTCSDLSRLRSVMLC